MAPKMNDFLVNVSPTIQERGAAYYSEGRVEYFLQNGNRFSAEVIGSEGRTYSVNVQLLKDGKVDSWSCTCPYDRGGACKHVVAVLLKAQHDNAMPRGEANDTESVTLSQLLEKAAPDELRAIISAHARTDDAFYAEAVSVLGVPPEQELRLAKECIRSSIRRNTHRGYIDWEGCDGICEDMDAILAQARRRLERGQPSAAIELAEYIALVGIDLASSADSSSGSLTMTLNEAQDLLGQGSAALCRGNFTAAEKQKALEKLLKAARNKAFDGWPSDRHVLLRAAIPLCEDKSAVKLFALLDNLLEAEMQKPYPEYYISLDRETRFYLIQQQEGTQAAHIYLMQNLDVDRIRELAVQEALDAGQFSEAERLPCKNEGGRRLPLRTPQPMGSLALYNIRACRST